MEQRMEQYCRKVRDFLQCPPEDAQRCISDVQRTAERLRQEEPEISQEEIEAFLGEPEEVARMFEDTLDAAQVEQYRSRKKMRFGILIGVLLAGIIAALCLAYYMMVTPRCVSSMVITQIASSEPSEGETP